MLRKFFDKLTQDHRYIRLNGEPFKAGRLDRLIVAPESLILSLSLAFATVSGLEKPENKSYLMGSMIGAAVIYKSRRGSLTRHVWPHHTDEVACHFKNAELRVIDKTPEPDAAMSPMADLIRIENWKKGSRYDLATKVLIGAGGWGYAFNPAFAEAGATIAPSNAMFIGGMATFVACEGANAVSQFWRCRQILNHHWRMLPAPPKPEVKDDEPLQAIGPGLPLPQGA
ncbi:MAG: hypothetical protein AB7E85_01030 [Pseudobdellovibrionaceae bacterium]